MKTVYLPQTKFAGGIIKNTHLLQYMVCEPVVHVNINEGPTVDISHALIKYKIM